VEYHSDKSSGIGSIIFFRYYYYYLFDRPAALAYAGGRRRTIRISIDMWARGATSDGKKTRAQSISFWKKKKKIKYSKKFKKIYGLCPIRVNTKLQ